jgi:hypothetical protein
MAWNLFVIERLKTLRDHRCRPESKVKSMKSISKALVSAALAFTAAAALVAETHAQTRTVSTQYFDLTFSTTASPWLQSAFISDASQITRDFNLMPSGGYVELNFQGGASGIGLGTSTFVFDFKGPLVSPDSFHPDLQQVSSIIPGSAMFKTVSYFTKPANAQLATSFGSDTLTVTSSAPESNSTFNGGIIASAGSTNILAGPTANPNFLSPIASVWQSAPGAGGTWQINISQQLLGSNHLVPSQDPNCASLLCMPAVRASGDLQSFQIRFALDAVAQPVPEPSAYAMMFAGLMLIVSIGRRRSAKSAA